ncbi:recombinase family protein [Clostridium niameyense]|uniref:recombinase family protein n=1 Tax=Clostridium niameyense TaxID=1622073 RepID=UPI00067EDD91|nr:recombinase family protein [Clostridium niameyense]
MKIEKIAIYARRSEEKETGESIKNQINICRNYIERIYKNPLIDEYFDDDYSGRNMIRPDFNKMMILVKKGYYKAIVFWKLDRVARNALDFLKLHKELDKLGVNLISVTEGFDPSTPAGKLMMTMLAAVAEMERKNISQRVISNMNEMAKKGKWTGGITPYGYKTITIKKEKYLKEDNDTIKTVKEIFDKYLETESLFQVSKWLKQSYNIKKSPTSIKRILTNLVYVKSDNEISKYLTNRGINLYGQLNGNGLVSYGKANKTNDEGVEFRNISEWIVAIGKHKGIISGLEYIKVQHILKSKNNSGRRGTGDVTFLNGLCRCSYCGSYMRTKQKKKTNGGYYKYFACAKKDTGLEHCKNKMIKISDVEETVLNALYNYKINNIHTNNTPIDTSKLRNDLNKKQKQIKNLVLKLSLDDELEDIFLEQIRELKKEVNELQKNIEEKEKENLLNNVSNYNKDSFIKQLSNFKNIFINCKDIDSKRKLIKNLVKEIRIDGINKKTELETYF